MNKEKLYRVYLNNSVSDYRCILMLYANYDLDYEFMYFIVMSFRKWLSRHIRRLCVKLPSEF